MTKKDHHPLVPVPPGSLTETAGGPHRVLARMSSDVLGIVRAKERELEEARFRIGEYEFRGPDYRQILRWANTCNMSPEELVECLAETRMRPVHEPEVGEDDHWPSIDFVVEDGAIVSLAWDVGKLQIKPDEWEEDLHIHTLGLTGNGRRILDDGCRFPPPLPWLKVLVCEYALLESLELSGVPSLLKLYCSLTPLGELDLSSVQKLKELDCQACALTRLDLSHVPDLSKLWCNNNRIKNLELSHVPRLTALGCGENDLNEVDLSCVPGLTEFDCSGSKLTELDLSHVSGLKLLSCCMNELTELDLSPVPELAKLFCFGNLLTDLDLATVPQISSLICNDNRLTVLDIRPLGQPQYLRVDPDVRIIGAPPDGCEVDRL